MNKTSTLVGGDAKKAKRSPKPHQKMLEYEEIKKADMGFAVNMREF